MKFTWNDPGRPLSPDEYQAVLPTGPSRSSTGVGWTGIHLEEILALPAGESDVPALSHLYVVMLGRNSPGRVSVRCDGVEYLGDGRPGTVGVVPAGLARQARWENTVDWTVAQIDPALIARVALEACDLDPARVAERPIFHDPWPPLVAAVSALRDEVLSGGLGGRLCAESLANVIAVHLIRRFADDPTERATCRLAGPVLRAVADYIMDNLECDLALADLSAIAGLSESHFARQFKAATGQSPHQYVIGQRVERAKELIIGRGRSLAEVAAAVGFADQSHLTHHFRRIVGVTPGRFS